MKNIIANARGLRGSRARRFSRHYLEMVVVMVVSMMIFAPVWQLCFWVLGSSRLLDRADLTIITMATNMTLGMVLWMALRGHRRRPVAEMAAAMYLPFLMLLGPLWAGVLTEKAVLGFGHVLMLFAMAVVMLIRPQEYADCHNNAHSNDGSTGGPATEAARPASTDEAIGPHSDYASSRP